MPVKTNFNILLVEADALLSKQIMSFLLMVYLPSTEDFLVFEDFALGLKYNDTFSFFSAKDGSNCIYTYPVYKS